MKESRAVGQRSGTNSIFSSSSSASEQIFNSLCVWHHAGRSFASEAGKLESWKEFYCAF